MNKPIIALTLGLTVILSSCSIETIKPLGNVISENGPSGTFEKVDAGAAFDVFITYPESENSIEIKADDNLI
ncbi:MAG: hypothetical protein ACI959_000127 [Limisphaerales bacterium]|jgi:hypothetical protein